MNDTPKLDKAAYGGSPGMACSPSSDVRRCGEVTICRNGYVEELERERDELRAKYAMHHAEAERMTAESIRLKFTLAKWQAWARMHGHLEHAAGIAAETQEILSENDQIHGPRP